MEIPVKDFLSFYQGVRVPSASVMSHDFRVEETTE